MVRSSMLQMGSSVNDKIIRVTDGVECESSMLQMARV